MYSTCMYLYLPYRNAALLAHTEITKLKTEKESEREGLERERLKGEVFCFSLPKKQTFRFCNAPIGGGSPSHCFACSLA
jgi:hypothetical protein